MANVARSSAVMFAGTLTSRILGLFRSPLLFAIVVGLNYPAGNAFDIANRLPTLIYMIVAGGVVNAVLVPAIVRAAKRDTDGGQAYINKLVTLGVTVLGGITLILTIAAPLLVKIAASGLRGDFYSLAVAFAYLCIPQVFFYGMYTLLGQVLNAKENFGPYMWAPALNNVVAIAGLLVLFILYGSVDPNTANDASAWDTQRILILGGSATAGIASQALILLIPLRRMGIKLRPDFKFRGAGLSTAAKSGSWVLLTLLAGMIPTLLTSNVAAVASDRSRELPVDEALGVVGNAGYTAAYTLYSLPTSLIVVSIVTAIFTSMAQAAADNDRERIKEYTSRALRIIAIFTFLSTALIVVLAVPSIRIISPGSSWPEVTSISTVLVTMSLGLVAVGSFTVLQRVYYALEDTRSLFFIQLPFLTILSGLILTTLLLPIERIVATVGVAMSATNVGTALATFVLLSRRLGGLDGRRILVTYGKLFVISIVAGLLGYGLSLVIFTGPELRIIHAALKLVLIATIMTLVYLGLMKLWKMEEIAPLGGLITKLIGKARPGSTPQGTTLEQEQSTPTTGGTVAEGFSPGQKLRDRYELVAPLDSALSGQREVWQSRDTVLGTTVRLIIIGQDHERREAVLDAARRGVFVDDVRLVKLLSIFDTDDASVIVTEIPQGRPLTDYIANGPVEVAQARAIVGETAGALDAGVRRGVRHPYLRPELITIDSSSDLYVDGLGIDGELAGPADDDLSAKRDRHDATNLSLLLATLLLGQQQGDTDTADFLNKAADRDDLPDELENLLRGTAEGHGAVSTGDLIRGIVPWTDIDVSALPHVDDVPDSEPTEEPAEAPARGSVWPGANNTADHSSADETTVMPEAGTTTPPPPPPSDERAHWAQSPTWDDLTADDDHELEEEEKSGFFTPTVLIVALAALLVLLCGFWAFKTLTKDTHTVDIPENTIETTQEETTTEETQEAEPTEEETTEEALPEPAISNVTLLNPEADALDPSTADSQDNPRDIPLIFDGDPATYWSSWWYGAETFYMKTGLGLEITLAEETEVSEIAISNDGTGGNVQWRATDAANPKGGDVIVEGPLSPESVLTAPEPVKTSSIILWFDRLPVANTDGEFRLDIGDIQVR